MDLTFRSKVPLRNHCQLQLNAQPSTTRCFPELGKRFEIAKFQKVQIYEKPSKDDFNSDHTNQPPAMKLHTLKSLLPLGQ